MVSDSDPSQFKLGADIRAALGWQLRELYRGMAATATQEQYPARLRELLDRLDRPDGIELAGDPSSKSS